jgi:hypothetical protein
MYRIKVTGYVQYLEGEDPNTSLQKRVYDPGFGKFAYRNAFHDASVLERDFSTESEARAAMEKSYKGVDDHGLGFTWTVVRQGSIVVKGAQAIAYAERKGEDLYAAGENGPVDFARALKLIETEPDRVYTTAAPYYISELVAVNPARSQVVTISRASDNVGLYRAPALAKDSEGAWWYYLETDGKPQVIDPENPDPKVTEALQIEAQELNQILEFHLAEMREEEEGISQRIGV